MTPSATRLVADIGGTNTRIALFDPGSGEYRHQRNYINRDFRQLEDVIALWLGDLSEPAPLQCCIAVAAPPSVDRVRMSNMDWSFSCRDIAARFGFSQLLRLNDFEANAYALPHLGGADCTQLFPGEGGPSGRLATVGPGTGLGGAFLVSLEGSEHSFACEPGHMGLTPGNELELDIFRLLTRSHSNIYAELLLSGPGLTRLHRVLAELQGQETPLELSPAEISRQALLAQDELCVLTLDTFSGLLGSICGDFLLATGSYGGLYLAGGIIPRMTEFLVNSSFHERMLDKGAMRPTLARVPVYAITSAQPGLIGAAHARIPG